MIHRTGNDYARLRLLRTEKSGPFMSMRRAACPVYGAFVALVATPSPLLARYDIRDSLGVQHITSRAANSRLNTSRKVTSGCESLPLQLHGIRLTTGFCVPSMPHSTQLQLPTQTRWSAVSRQQFIIRNSVLSPSIGHTFTDSTSHEALPTGCRDYVSLQGNRLGVPRTSKTKTARS